MQSIAASTPSGEMASTLPNEPDNSLDNLACELARKKPPQHEKDEPQRELVDVFLPLQLRPLPAALDALRRGGNERVKLSLGHGTKSDKAHAEGETSKTRPNLDKSHPLQTSALTGKGSTETQVTDTDESQGASAGIIRSASVAPTSTLREASKRKLPDETGVSILPTSQPVPLLSPRMRIESQNIMPRQELVPMQMAVAPNTQQGGMTYRFSRWGADYTVSVQVQAGDTILLQPSDPLVAQKLNDQWQSGNPQKWQLAQDGGEGRGQRHQQEHEEDEA